MKNLAEVKFNQELFAQAEECATPEELVALAKTQGIELSAEEAKSYLAYLTRDLTEEELQRSLAALPGPMKMTLTMYGTV